MNDAKTAINDLKALVAQFVNERAWQPYHDAKNLSMAIAIEAAELMEHFQWVRSDAVDEVLRDPATRAEIVDELADILAFVLALSNAAQIDLSSALEQKMLKNAAKYPAEQFRGRYEKRRAQPRPG